MDYDPVLVTFREAIPLKLLLKPYGTIFLPIIIKW